MSIRAGRHGVDQKDIDKYGRIKSKGGEQGKNYTFENTEEIEFNVQYETVQAALTETVREKLNREIPTVSGWTDITSEFQSTNFSTSFGNYNNASFTFSKTTSLEANKEYLLDAFFSNGSHFFHCIINGDYQGCDEAVICISGQKLLLGYSQVLFVPSQNQLKLNFYDFYYIDTDGTLKSTQGAGTTISGSIRVYKKDL